MVSWIAGEQHRGEALDLAVQSEGEAPTVPVPDRGEGLSAGVQMVGEKARGPAVFGEVLQAGGGSVRFDEAGE